MDRVPPARRHLFPTARQGRVTAEILFQRSAKSVVYWLTGLSAETRLRTNSHSTERGRSQAIRPGTFGHPVAPARRARLNDRPLPKVSPV